MQSICKNLFIIAMLISHAAYAEKFYIGEFSQSSLQGWQPKIFSGETQYRFIEKNDASKQVILEAHSMAAASGLVREIKVDLRKTPYLNWSWKINNIIQGPDERSKAGDDYPARIYVVVSGGLAFWNTKSLNYVWANRIKAGSQWPNAYTDQAQMLALQSGDQDIGQWKSERRNVRDDLQALFGESIDHIDAIAIMTDTDQSGAQAIAWYGDIWFSSE